MPNGIEDLNLEGFHPSIIQKPARKTCKGGGLSMYLNKNLCNEDDFEIFDLPDFEHSTINGEFMLVKLRRCKRLNKMCIVGNIYRSPSTNPTNFIDRFESLLSKLSRYDKKQLLLMGDINIDLIKHSHDNNCQNLIDL